MAWRPTQYLLEGELDNSIPGRVSGWMRFAGLPQRVTFSLKGDFHRDIRGTRIHLQGEGQKDDPTAASYMDSFAIDQQGKVGDITAGLPPRDYVDYPYIEWYGDANGRVVIELASRQIQVLGNPKTWLDSKPVSRKEQARNMASFLRQVNQELRAPVICLVIKSSVEHVEKSDKD